MRPERYGESAFIGLLQKLLTHGNQEVCRAAAYRLCLLGQLMPNQIMDSRGECRALFAKHGLQKTARAGTSRLNPLFRDLSVSFGLKAYWFRPIQWLTILEPYHEDVLKYVVRLLADHKANRDQFILGLDAALETVFERIWTKGGFANIDLSGKALKNANRGTRIRSDTAFSDAYPATRLLMKAVNDLRNRSELAHRKNTHSGTRNRAVSYDDVSRAMKLMPSALIELARLHPETP